MHVMPSVRIAEDTDVDTLAELRRVWNEEHVGATVDDGFFAGAFRDWWSEERPTRTFFLVHVDGQAVGMANVKHYRRMPVAGRPSDGWWGYVGNVFVLA